MSLTEIGIVVLGGVIGWGVVSWLISIVRQQRQPPVAMGTDPPPETHRATKLIVYDTSRADSSGDPQERNDK
jgi:hypothetical protein